MPILGLVSVTYRKLSPADVITRAVEAGLSCIEWGSDIHVPQTDPVYARHVGDMTREAGLTVSSYGSYYRLGAGQDFAPYLEAARALQAPVIRKSPAGSCDPHLGGYAGLGADRRRHPCHVGGRGQIGLPHGRRGGDHHSL